MAQKERDEFKPGDHVSWKYGVGKATGRIVGKVTEDTKLGGRTFRATPDDPKYRMTADKSGKEVVRRGAVLSRIEESAEPAHADERDESREESEHSEESDEGEEAKAGHKSEAPKAHKDQSKSKEGEEEAGKGAGDKDADKGSKDPPSAGTSSLVHGAEEPEPTIKAGLITGTGGDASVASEADEDLDLTKRSLQLGANDAPAQADVQESTVDNVPVEYKSAWQLGNQPEPVDKDVASEHKPVGHQNVEEQSTGPAIVGGSQDQDATDAKPHGLPHEEVPQPDQFASQLLQRYSPDSNDG